MERQYELENVMDVEMDENGMAVGTDASGVSEVTETLVAKGTFDKAWTVKRTEQLIELMHFDPENARIYRNELVEINIRLVPHVIKKYRPYGDDEFQVGCIGLLKAADKYEPQKKVPFSSFACFCIEREIHTLKRAKDASFEGQMAYDLFSIDETVDLGEDKVNKHEQIADRLAEEQLHDLIGEHDLAGFFDTVIEPAITAVKSYSRGQKTTTDLEAWAELEMRYMMEMAREDSQKARITFTFMAQELGTSVQRVRGRHQRVLEVAQALCRKYGYHE